MNKKILIVFALMLLSGIFLIGKSITGLVISQSCCFGEECSEEYLCDSAKGKQNNLIDINLGALFLIASVSLFKLTHQDKI